MGIKNRLGFAFDYTPKSGRILDIGCDYGEFTVNYLKKSKQVFAIDPNKEVIAHAKKRYKNRKIHFIAAPAEKIPFPDSYFDTITITDAFEHVANEKKTMNEIYRVLKPEGTLIFSVPYKGWFRFIDAFNMKFYFPKVYKWFKGKYYNPKIYDEAPWHRHYSLKDLKKFFKGRFVVEKKHRGGLFLYPFLWLIQDSIYWKWKPPKWILKIHEFLSDLDYSMPYGSAAFHITLRARSIKKK